jgi:hypothetical protein
MGREYRRTAMERAELVAEQHSSGKTQIAGVQSMGLVQRHSKDWASDRYFISFIPEIS